MEQRLCREHKNKIKTINNIFREIKEYIAVLKQESNILNRSIQRTNLFPIHSFHLEMKTMMTKNRNLTEGLGDKVKEFSEKAEPKVKEIKKNQRTYEYVVKPVSQQQFQKKQADKVEEIKSSRN